MLAKLNTLSLLGIEALLVEVEVDVSATSMPKTMSVSYTHLRAHETVLDLVCRLLLEKKKQTKQIHNDYVTCLHMNYDGYIRNTA